MNTALYRALPYDREATPVTVLGTGVSRVDQGPFDWRVVNDGVRVRDEHGRVWVAAPFQIER